MITNSHLKNIFIQAVQEFYKKDSELLCNAGGMERTCVARIYHYLCNIVENNNLFQGLHVDLEYNKSNIGTKLLDNKQVIPDLIIHRRNLNNTVANDSNTLILEVKGYWNNEHDNEDIEKLEKFTSINYGYNYQLGIFLKLGKTIEECKYYYFVNGRKILLHK